MTECSRGHQNPAGQRFCGECGAGIYPQGESEREDAPDWLVTNGTELPNNQGFLLRRPTFTPERDEVPSTPGWYPHPSGGTGQLYWDGTKWIDATAPVAPQSPKNRLSTPPWKVLLTMGVAIALGVGGCVAVIALGNDAVSTTGPPSKSLISSSSTPPESLNGGLFGAEGDQDVSMFRSEVTENADLHLKGGDDGARRIAAEICVDLAMSKSQAKEAAALVGPNISAPAADALVAASVRHFCPFYN